MESKHYLVLDDNKHIIDGFSDGPHPERSTEGTVCLTEQGSYQFRLKPDGEENPPLHTEDWIPLYKWTGTKVAARTKKEIEADRIAASKE